MLFDVEIRGLRPIIHHSGTGIDPKHPANIEKSALARITASNRTEDDEARLAELECQVALWLDEDGRPTIPAAALRSCIETAARRLRQGPQVREGLVVDRVHEFRYDVDRYGDELTRLVQTTQFRIGVVVQRQRILRTRAMFEPPWGCRFTLDCDDELVDQQQLEAWLDIAGRRIGLGDWRPEKSGDYGRFETVSVKPQ
jgi:hypothetical protein